VRYLKKNNAPVWFWSQVKMFNVILSNNEKIEMALALMESREFKEVEQIFRTGIITSGYHDRIKNHMTFPYKLGDMESLKYYIKLFKVNKPKNTDMLPPVFLPKLVNSEDYLKMMNLIPSNNDEKTNIWKHKLYRTRSADFAYRALMFIGNDEYKWASALKWCMNLFSPVIKYASIDDICSKYKDQHPCTISLAIINNDSTCLKIMVDKMKLTEKIIVRHCLCCFNQENLYNEPRYFKQSIQNASDMNFNKVVDNLNMFFK